MPASLPPAGRRAPGWWTATGILLGTALAPRALRQDWRTRAAEPRARARRRGSAHGGHRVRCGGGARRAQGGDGQHGHRVDAGTLGARARRRLGRGAAADALGAGAGARGAGRGSGARVGRGRAAGGVGGQARGPARSGRGGVGRGIRHPIALPIKHPRSAHPMPRECACSGPCVQSRAARRAVSL
jgi:hypothetical protein